MCRMKRRTAKCLAAERLRRAYDAAMAAGEFDDEARAWYRTVAITLATVWDAE